LGQYAPCFISFIYFTCHIFSGVQAFSDFVGPKPGRVEPLAPETTTTVVAALASFFVMFEASLYLYGRFFGQNQEVEVTL
jgi:hypothetical protein